ncbi:uncharacterized protein LOC119113958 isoform X2 [Pollicipes pollicipes]|uniref:uncharacterized protein LOC119113958 isoform X2 n=1 Tax=Pollicipes pollicipes TaxID=41117 RepID=UPI0018852881|nr:uncharacterized protein LOC119113958 isoform X2 [Pollicipes pollicipes]
MAGGGQGGGSAEEAGDEGEEGEGEKAGTGKRSVDSMLADAKNKAKGMLDGLKGKMKEQMDKFKATMSNWSDKMKNSFSSLKQSIKDKINGGNVTALTDAEIDELSLDNMRTLAAGSRLEVMTPSQKAKFFARFKAGKDSRSMQKVLDRMEFDTRSQLLDKFNEVNAELGNDEAAKKMLAMSVMDRLGDARNWSLAEVNKMKTVKVFSRIPPAKLMRINNTAILNTISKPSKSQLYAMQPGMRKNWAALIAHIENASLPSKDWTSSKIQSLQHVLGSMPLDMLKMLRDAPLAQAFSSAPASDTMYDPAQAKVLLDKLVSEFKRTTTTPSPAAVKTFVTRLGPLGKFLNTNEMIDMVDSTMRDRTNEIATMLRDTIGKKSAPLGQRCDVFKRTQRGVNLTELIKSDVNKIVNDGMLSCVPDMYLKNWAEDSKLTFTQLAQSNSMLTSGKINVMAQAAVKQSQFQKTTGEVDMQKLPGRLMGAVPSSAITKASWSELSGLKPKIRAGEIMFDRSQKARFVRKGLGGETTEAFVTANLDPAYYELIPVEEMKKLSSASKKNAAMYSGPNSHLRIISAEAPSPVIPTAITKENVEDLLQPGMPFFDAEKLASSISSENAQSTIEKLQQVLEANEEDQLGLEGPSRRTCAALKTRLANYTQMLSADADNDTSILSALTESDLLRLPGCVLGRLRAGTVKDKANMKQKKAILYSLGKTKPLQLKLIPKKKLPRARTRGTESDETHRQSHAGRSGGGRQRWGLLGSRWH